MATSYAQLADRIRGCTACFFRDAGIEPLPAVHAHPPVSIMFVGENPSWQAGQAAPFDPRTISGQSLDTHYLKALSLSRDDVWVTDLFKCRYPKAIYRSKTKNETRVRREVVQTCAQWLLAEIAYAQPKVLVTLSNTQVYQRIRHSFSLPIPASFAAAAGKSHVINLNGQRLTLFPMVHPDIARPPNEGDRRKLPAREKWADRHAREHIPALVALMRSKS